ncbi:MAG: 5-(carboxyamino)imidazole ribonucleotide synthase [Acidobacteria bacterium]|nr:5-(carboxyamino)imidazole ribonucleotide synthase [Acidobacteriota bacterium]
MIAPGAALGVLGSGQLGRMFAMAARRLGYRVHTFSPERDTPTGQIADVEVCASYDDLDAVRAFASGVAAVTFEFENVSAAAAAAAESVAVVRPAGRVLHITQHRLREKTFLAGKGFPVTPFRTVGSLEDCHAAAAELGLPAVLKTAGFGYDGKGQRVIQTARDIPAAWAAMAGAESILEAFVPFEREISVVAARSHTGEFVHYGVMENRHANHILDVTITPAAVSGPVANEAAAIARGVLEALDVVGVLCVEMFLESSGGLLINELAPRPHNSGHVTIEAHATSQFEQQVRALCGLPLGSTELVRPGAMANLLGGLWQAGEPNWAAALEVPGARLHLYGKGEARPGRKMGHITALGATAGEARGRAVLARQRLADSQ